MRAFYFFGAFGLLTAASVARAECDDLLNLSLPLSGDTTLKLSSAAVDCTILADNELEEFVIEGGTLTLTGASTTKFTNLRFTVMDGAGLVFDFDTTEFGPNLGFERQDNFNGFMVQVMSGGSVEFTGELAATGLENMRSVFWNDVGGSIEFASNVVFNDCDSNVFRDNFGRLRFRSDVTFTENRFLSISNRGGTVRIDGDASFVTNGRSFDGHSGGAFSNTNGGTAIFRGTAVFSDNSCDESGGGVLNGADSKMTFYKNAGFFDNRCRNGDGGGIDNAGGDLKFRGTVSMNGNEAAETGGGISTGNGGTTTFYRKTTITSNQAGTNGGGMSLYGSDESSLVTFRKSDKIEIGSNQSNTGCNSIYVAENSELVGYDTTSDICDGA